MVYVGVHSGMPLQAIGPPPPPPPQMERRCSPRSELLEALLMMRIVSIRGRFPHTARRKASSRSNSSSRLPSCYRLGTKRDLVGGEKPRPRDASEGYGRHWCRLSGEVGVVVLLLRRRYRVLRALLASGTKYTA